MTRRRGPANLSSRHRTFAERLRNYLPFVFVDQIAGFVCSDFLHINAVAFQNANHLPNTGNVLGGAGPEPADAKPQLLMSEGGGLFQILAKLRSQFVQLICVGARNVSPLQRQRCCLKDSLLDMTVLVLTANDEANVFAFF
jgi:hypothetical protein